MSDITLSEFILANLEKILVEWENFAKTIAPASGMDAAALRDDAKAILITIAHDMASEQSHAEQKTKSRGTASIVVGPGETSAVAHGVARLEERFSLIEMVSEYRALRASVIRLWQGKYSQFGGALYELIRFSEGVDQALAESITLYADTRDRNKNIFLATLGHELLNPLAPLRTAVDSIRSNVNGEASVVPVTTLAMMERQVAQMARLIDDLVDVARIESGKLELRLQAVDITSIVNNAVEANVPPPDSHRVSVTLPNEPIYINADASRMRQVVGNLLNNALKFSMNATPIEVRVERKDNDIELTVTDTGCGIPAAKLEEIFEMFSQASRPRDPSKKGMGIGLALSRQIVKMHSGTIHAASDGRARGSTFVVRLPEVSQPVEGEQLRRREDANALKRILIADDNSDAADSMGLLLSRAGHDVRIAYDGLKALSMAIAFNPDIILLDLGMTGMGGIEVAKKIRQQTSSRPPTLIAVTGWGQEEDHQRSKDAGFDFHLVKPVALETLENLLRDLDHPLRRSLPHRRRLESLPSSK